MLYFKQLVLTVIIITVGLTSATAAKQTYDILFIQSYTEYDTWSEELIEGLEKGFKESGVAVNITTEFLNSRYWTIVGEEDIMHRMCERAEERGTDLVITSNDEALYTLLTYGGTFAAEVPIVFTGVQFPNYALLKEFSNVTGLVTPVAYDEMLNAITHIFPDRKQLIVLSEETSLGRWGVKTFKKEWEGFVAGHDGYSVKEFNLTFDLLTDILDEIQLSKNVSQSVIVVPYWGLYMPSIAKVSKVPTFSINASALMQGGFGVVAPDAYETARKAAKMASQILQGEEPASLEIRKSKNQITYDYKQLQFFHVDRDRIPKNGVIINEPYMEKYGVWFALLYALIIGLLITMVMRLVVANRRESRRRMHAQTKLLIQERLVAQRNEFDNVFHSIRDMVVTYDKDLRIHFINNVLLKELELPVKTAHASRPYEGQLTGSICVFMHNGENILPVLLKRVVNEGVSITIPENTFLQVTHSKKYFPISGEFVPLWANGKQIGVVLSFRNVSDEALQRHYYNLAVVESLIYPWQYNRELDKFTFPIEYMKRLGFGDETIMGWDKVNKIIHPDDLETIHYLFDMVISGKMQNARSNFRQRNASGRYEWWEVRMSAIRGLTEDVPYGVVGVCQSIQQYKTTEEELVSARDKALQADKLKSVFLANMSHEIRTPLNAIVGFSELLKDIHLFSEEEVKQFVDTINKNCELLLALISDILDLSRVEAGTMDFHFSSYFLPIIMQEVYESQRLNMPDGVELIKQIPDDSEKTIITDSVRLKQVLNNLINNAAKFTTSGSITFGYTEDEPGYTIFFVEDTGIGMSAEETEKIFQRFYKADKFTQGAGLGLSITQTILGRFNGAIAVESEEGKGTRFTVRIPDRRE